MIRNSILLKGIALFLVFETFFSSLTPIASWALTAGPTSPEATSFEPVDTTDMVNLVTGDFTYNTPLLEVPGPSGGYPLSLSYHAGIQPNVEASWVGLGFTLNPGAINRSTSGYTDDFSGIIGSERSFWEGGSTTTYTLGVNVGYAGHPSVSAGLTISDDTYRGFGVGHYAGVQAGASYGLFSIGVSAMGGVNPYGDSFSSTGLNVGIGLTASKSQGMVNASAKIGWGLSIASQNGGAASISSSTNVSAAISRQAQGTSISAGKSGINVQSRGGNASGQGSVHNSKSGNVSRSGYNYTFDIPTPWAFSVKLGKSYERYWIDETANVATNGALYFPTTLPTSAQLDTKAYDVYDLMDINQPFSTVVPEQSLAGSFIDYDDYQVLGQGISGTIRPYHYKSYLLRQNRLVDTEYKVKSYPLGVNKKASFRFVGDFSNRFVHNLEVDEFNASPPLSFTFDAQQVTGKSGNDGYIESSNVLPGSRAIEWFTNAEILDNGRLDEGGNPMPPPTSAAINRGFIDCQAMGFVREDDMQAGGFKITNESGITYHYALPVYSYKEYTYSGRQDEEGSHSFNVYKKEKPYAYTWLLTAVTGPDFVDRNQNGLADEPDWGYWVTFDYGMWSRAYSWRNPSSGFNKDIDQNFQNFSKGKKQVYYLNAIRTKTHTALFIKELRLDGKGVVNEIEEAVLTNGEHNIENIDKGGFGKETKTNGGYTYTEYPTSSLRLHSIYLIQNKDFPSLPTVAELSAQGNVYYHSFNAQADLGKFIHGKNVLDIHDIQIGSIKTDLRDKSLKKIEFITGYDLCPETPNSYKSELDVLNTEEPAVGNPQGKLTLRALKVYGRGEKSLIPETKFSYSKDDVDFYASVEDAPSSDANIHRLKVGSFKSYVFTPGDIIRLETIITSYGYVVDVDDAQDAIDVKFFVGAQYVFNSQTLIKFSVTENPPYNADQSDLWGFYKVDAENLQVRGDIDRQGSENERRMVTSLSAQHVDAWSLKEITTSLGAKIKIEYESDRYRNAIKSLANIPIKNISVANDNKTKITLHENLQEYGLTIGTQINLRFLTALRFDVINPGFNEELRFKCGDDEKTFTYMWITDDFWKDNTISIQSVDGNSFIINYDFKDRYPLNGANCISENPPYGEADGGSGPDCIDLDGLEVSEPIFLGGEILWDNSFSSYGGGVRVKKVTIEQAGKGNSTLYEYTNGVTSYEPLGFAMPIRKLDKDLLYTCLESVEQAQITKYRDYYVPDVYGKFQFLFANSRELPGPGVMYELVSVREQTEGPDGTIMLPGRTEYQFEVFSPETIDAQNTSHNALVNRFRDQFHYDPVAVSSTNYNGEVLNLQVNRIETRNSTTIEDFSAIMGSLKRITLYGEGDKKLTETINHYLHDEFDPDSFQTKLTNTFSDQGKITESFADSRIIINADQGASPTYSLYGLLSQKVKYPSVQTGQTTINYKTGIETHTENREFDFYSGIPTLTTTSDGHGNVYGTEVMPAYTKYAQMGPAAFGGKNMLSQEAGQISFKLVTQAGGAIQRVGIVSASTQTWSDSIAIDGQSEPQYGIWRKAANYLFNGDHSQTLANDGLLPYTNYSDFEAWNINDEITSGWIKTSGITLYDVNSHPLESQDINGDYTTIKMSSDQSQLLAMVVNSKYDQCGYSGAEDDIIESSFGGGIQKGSGEIVTEESDGDNTVHTGSRALRVDDGETGFRFLTNSLAGRNNFIVSVWTNSTSGKLKYKVNGVESSIVGATNLNRKSGSWYLIELSIPIENASSLEVWCEATGGTATFDDFRALPFDAVMQSYVYNQWGELSHILDNNNLYTEYEYDEMGRLIHTYKESFQYDRTKMSKIIYHYAGQD